MTTISPSLLSANFLNLESDLKVLNEFNDLWLHLDIMDGHFVPNITFGPVVIGNIHQVFKHPLDAHLMVSNPEKYISWLKKSKIYNLTYHLEVETDHFSLIKEIKSFYPSVGLSIKPHTPIEKLFPYLPYIDLALVMTVEPGFGGQSFMHECVQKIEALKKWKDENKHHLIIQVDGGINEQTAQIVRHAGATNLVAGSYIFNEDPLKYSHQIEKLKK